MRIERHAGDRDLLSAQRLLDTLRDARMELFLLFQERVQGTTALRRGIDRTCDTHRARLVHTPQGNQQVIEKHYRLSGAVANNDAGGIHRPGLGRSSQEDVVLFWIHEDVLNPLQASHVANFVGDFGTRVGRRFNFGLQPAQRYHAEFRLARQLVRHALEMLPHQLGGGLCGLQRSHVEHALGIHFNAPDLSGQNLS